MADIGKPQLAVYAAAAIVVALIGARFLHAQGGGGASAPPAPHHSAAAGVRVQAAGNGSAVVDVTGAVRHPGVYRVPASARVEVAVRRAGGTTGGADLTTLNQAAKVTDGAQIVVPARAGSSGSATAGGGAAPGGGALGAAPAAPVNLNTATVAQLDALDGVGPVTAQKIVAYRQQHGGFGSVSQLDQVPGIGPKKLASLRPLVTV